MITLIIPDDKLQAAFEKSLEEMLAPGNYNNPVKRALDECLGYSGSMRGEVGKHITDYFTAAIETPEFQATLGHAIAAEMAKRAVDALEKKK